MTTIVAYENGRPVTYNEAADRTRELLDDCFAPLAIGELTFHAGAVLEAMDPIAFRMTVLEEVDARVTDEEWTEEAPAIEEEAPHGLAYVGLWHGGNGYSRGEWATDAEIFETIGHALEVFEARARNRSYLASHTRAAEWDDNGHARKGAELDPLATPCVDDTAKLTLVRLDVARLDALETEDGYGAEAAVEFGPNGSIRVAYF